MHHLHPSVLIIEDQYDFRLDLAEFFRDSGWRVETAGSGREALLRLGSQDIDVWIVDPQLPDMDGLDLLRMNAIPKSPARTLILTSGLENGDLVDSLKLGCDIYLPKSAPLEAILAAAANLADRNTNPLRVEAGWVLRGKELIQLSSGNAVKLTPSEICLLATLGNSPKIPVGKGKLLESISRPHASQSNLEVLISRLRRKLHEGFDNPPQIIPLYGAGYMIDCAISS